MKLRRLTDAEVGTYLVQLVAACRDKPADEPVGKYLRRKERESKRSTKPGRKAVRRRVSTMRD